MEDFEREHQRNIEKLIGEFGKERKEEIIKKYNEKRKDYGERKIKDYVYLLMYKEMREKFSGVLNSLK